MHDAAKSRPTGSPDPSAESLPSAPGDRGSRSLSIAALIFVAMAAVMGWGASFVGLHEYGMQSMAGFTYWSAWLVPATFDGAAFACTLMTYRSSINGRSAVRGRILMWAFTGVSSWINWIHQPSQEAQIVAAGLPIAAVAVFDVVLLELRADYEAKHGMRGFRLRPGLLVLRWMVDRRSTGEAFRKQVIDIPVEEIAGLGTLAPPGTRRANALKAAAASEQAPPVTEPADAERPEAATTAEPSTEPSTERTEPAPRAEARPRVDSDPAVRASAAATAPAPAGSSTADDERTGGPRDATAPRATSSGSARSRAAAADAATAAEITDARTAAAESGSAEETAGSTAEDAGTTAGESGATAGRSGATAGKSDAKAGGSGANAGKTGADAGETGDSAHTPEATDGSSTAATTSSGAPATTGSSAEVTAPASADERPTAEDARPEPAEAPTVTLELPKVAAEDAATAESTTAKTTAKPSTAKQKPAGTTSGAAKKPADVSDAEQTLTLPPVPDRPMSDQDKRSAARADYRMSVAAEQPVKPAELAKRYGLSESWGRRQINAARKSMAQEEAHEKAQLVGADQS